MIDSSALPENTDSVGNGAFEKRVRRHVVGRSQSYFAVTAPGFEDICRRELAGLGIDDHAMVMEPGGVAFTARFVDCQRANLYLRTCTRILMRVDTFIATNLRRLAKKADGIAWELFLPKGTTPGIKVSSHRSRLYHTAAVAGTLQERIVRRLNEAGGRRLPKTALPQTVFARFVEDQVTLSVDSSGEALYKRGLKQGPARAPIRETLAAAILMAADYEPRRPLVDPMCGSGTFSLEAAMLAKQMAPGMMRRFAFMEWPAYSENQWAFLKREAASRMAGFDRPMILASDIDGETCRRLTDTVVENDLTDAVRVERKDIFHCGSDPHGGGPGLVVVNPPYGVRLGSVGQADNMFERICRHLINHFNGWRVALIVPRPQLLQRLPFPASQIPLSHGGLKLTLVLGTL